MDLEQITGLVKSLSGIGIVVMLVYLALQLRQRNLASRFDGRRSMGGFPGGGMPGGGDVPPGMPGGGGFPPELPDKLAKQLASLGVPGVAPTHGERAAPPSDDEAKRGSETPRA